MIAWGVDPEDMNDHPALEDVSSRLWDQRRILTYLLFKLTATDLLVAADDRRFVPRALEEVDRAVELLRQSEQRRACGVRELARLWQLAPDQLTLGSLAHHAPEPHDHIFMEHLHAFQELVDEIGTLAREYRSLADGGGAGPDGLFDDRLDAIDRALRCVRDGLGTTVAAANGGDPVTSRDERLSLSTRTELPEADDVDLAQGQLDLQLKEVGHQATVSALDRALPPSLIAFLR